MVAGIASNPLRVLWSVHCNETGVWKIGSKDRTIWTGDEGNTQEGWFDLNSKWRPRLLWRSTKWFCSYVWLAVKDRERSSKIWRMPCYASKTLSQKMCLMHAGSN